MKIALIDFLIQIKDLYITLNPDKFTLNLAMIMIISPSKNLRTSICLGVMSAISSIFLFKASATNGSSSHIPTRNIFISYLCIILLYFVHIFYHIYDIISYFLYKMCAFTRKIISIWIKRLWKNEKYVQIIFSQPLLIF